MAKDTIAMKWKGNGFFVGVPSRDLTGEEVDRYGRDFLLSLGLYEDAEQPKPKRTEVIEPEPDEKPDYKYEPKPFEAEEED